MLYINGTGNFSTLIIEIASTSKSGSTFMGLTYTGTTRLRNLEGDSQTKKRNPYVHRFIF